MARLSPSLCAFLAFVACGGSHALTRGKFADEATSSAIDDMLPSERLKSFRGGFDRGDDVPTRARRPQPDYDNYKYGGSNFFQHELIYLEDNLIMDWQASTGEYRVFELVRQPTDMCPLIPERPIMHGFWPHRIDHKLVYIGCTGAPPGAKIFDYSPRDGTYSIFRFNHRARHPEDPAMEELSHGFRREILNFQPIYVNEDEMLFYEKATGSFSSYFINNQLPSKVDPLQPPEPLLFGKVNGLHEQLTYVGQNTILDYDPLFGRWWLNKYDRTAVNNTNPFIPLARGVIEKGMVTTYVAKDQIVILDPETGIFGAFDLQRPWVPAHGTQWPGAKASDTGGSFGEDGDPGRQDDNAADAEEVVPQLQLKSAHGNYGYGSLVRADMCANHTSCKSCLQLPGCGWCETNKECMRGSTATPCSGNCTDWHPVICIAEPCSSHRGCSACLADPFCGWCADTDTCTEGMEAGPLFGTCSGWSKLLCPHLSHTGETDSVQPCVEDGLIS